MKHCKSCAFVKIIEIPSSDRHMGQIQYLCTHMENTDPVSGDEMPCNIARTQPDFCGLRGKHWQKKPEPTVLKETGNIINLGGF